MNKFRLQHIVPKKGELFFFCCPESNAEDIEKLRKQISKQNPEINAIFANYEIKIKHVNVLKPNILHLHCKGETSKDEFRELSGLVIEKMNDVKDQNRDKKAKIKFILKK